MGLKPNWHLTCSCGARTVAKFNERRECYVTEDPKWRFEPDTSKPEYNWTCGAPGHTRGAQHPVGGHERADLIESGTTVLAAATDDEE
jgi:hypothetical protein